ncbi:hypothetical protein MLD38_028290 [Melastoma candidum]|uniref:Uncharacterized protein n=2 Tax=Melastoma candidum TaxID=119954 RepID=A0ACB9N4X7_9MYRT|nr:hypothetical protein MLD38_028290 [Melastoma candidum]KAI4329971.1 hypothetical protein MLD38_028290 [Melastoma candidum]
MYTDDNDWPRFKERVDPFLGSVSLEWNTCVPLSPDQIPGRRACKNLHNLVRMTVLKRYMLRLFISLKYITANVVDRNNGRIVATASTVEHSIKNTLECGRCCNAKAAGVVGEVLAMRLKVEGLEQGQGRGIHVNMRKEVEKKGFKNRTKIWAVVNSMKNNGVKVVLDETEDDDNPCRPSW